MRALWMFCAAWMRARSSGVTTPPLAFAWFFMFFLVFVRVLPAFSIAEIKETLPAPRRAAGSHR